MSTRGTALKDGSRSNALAASGGPQENSPRRGPLRETGTVLRMLLPMGLPTDVTATAAIQLVIEGAVGLTTFVRADWIPHGSKKMPTQRDTGSLAEIATEYTRTILQGAANIQ